MKSILHFFLTLFIVFFNTRVSFSQSGRLPAPAEKGMVVSSHYLASQAGDEILKKGGNAVDAAVATAFALAVTLPSAGNIGGGGFLVYHGYNGQQTTFNFREKAPLAATSTMYLDENGKIKNNSNHEGLLSVGVPGTVAGLYQAHQKLGKLKWAELVAPAVKLAKKGFSSTWAMQDFLENIEANKEKYPSTAAAFLKNGETKYKPGENWKQKDLASSLKRIQKHGADGFYKGKTAQLLVDFMKANGGLITHEDLTSYKAEELKPIHGTYRGYDIYSMPPPSSGGVALVEMLNILEGYNLTEMGSNSGNYLHLLTEAMRRAYADRAQFIGDPNFNPDMPIERLISKPYAEKLRKSINLNQAGVSDSSKFAAVYLRPESPETTHLSVVDQEGNAVSLTYTLENSYGAKIVVPGAGFLLNDEMGDFNPVPGVTNSQGQIGTPPNLVAPEKRMLSSMTPTIVAKDGKPILVIGSPGGRTIINTTMQVILNVLDHRMNVAEAIESPRIHHQWLPDVTSFESFGFSPDTRKIYEGLGHRINSTGNIGSAMGIFIDHSKKRLYGGADSRSFDGKAVGH
ncbi:gamma-glutamyltransferase [Adhaeribacter radiodurans]|uniref:Glutathione hydrolase proenzyme n=1 Tax=Adhaeribacter radiodurans TaxID=2745197 RepID=A0A7L7L4D6_9BACT|nr:gamma-glutamyltransferase [Adhaeribacter radiodurans]QMU27667.1 gamma-glutamyltransferase [Adhaeribacter radiodurans]